MEQSRIFVLALIMNCIFFGYFTAAIDLHGNNGMIGLPGTGRLPGLQIMAKALENKQTTGAADKAAREMCCVDEKVMISYLATMEKNVQAFQKLNENIRELIKQISERQTSCEEDDGQTQSAVSSKTSTTVIPPTETTCRAPVPTIPSNAKWMQNGVTVAGGHGHGAGLNQLNHPHGLAVDDDETVFIADTLNNRIAAWKPDDEEEGCVVAGGNGGGNRLNQLLHITDVLIDRETDSLIISDWLNRRIMRWSRQNGTTHGEIMFDNISCWGLTMDDEGSLYVTDAEKHEVRRYQRGEKMTTGTLVAGGNGQGNGLNQFSHPRYVSVDSEHAVYVSDNGNNRVMKWVTGAKEGIVVAGGQGPGGNLTQLNSPNGIVVDKEGTLYVADFGNVRVMRYHKGDKKGQIIVGGNGTNQLGGPVGLSFACHNDLYVVDYANARVQRFEIAHTT